MSKTKTISAVDKEKIETLIKINEYRKSCEANIVSIFWKNSELLYEHNNLDISDFFHNVWKVYFVIAQEIIIREKKKQLDEITVGLYLKEHPKLKKVYEDNGGWATIEGLKECVEEENIEGYIIQLNKWKAITGLLKNGFNVSNRLKDFIDMTLDEIYEEFDAILNHVFTNIESDEKVCDLTDGLYDLIENMDKGRNVGLPLKSLPILNAEVGGNLIGNITLCAGITGAGKSSVTRNILIPSIIENNEKLLIMINEEDEDKVKSEVMIYVINNILLNKTTETLQKYIVRNGKYSDKTKALLKQAADWMKQYKDIIKIIAFKQYTTSKAIKYIKKYSSLGFNYFVLDTFKRDFSENLSAEDHKVLAKSMSDLYDVVKPVNKNVHLWISCQLTKASDRQRFLGLSDLGVSKNMQDTVSTVIMIRKILDDEFEGEKKEIKVFKNQGKSKGIPVRLDSNKKYQIIFLPKNRFGTTDFQVVIEHDLSTNIYKEIGYCNVSRDY